MEGVGARLGRSSTRYGPPTVFTGPVRKWKKKWVHAPPSNSNHHNTAAKGTVNGSNGSSHLMFYKWTPMTPSQNKESNNANADSNNSSKDDTVSAEETPKRKFKYIPAIVVLEEQKNESSEENEDEAKPTEPDTNTVEATSKSDGYDEKPDINDIPMEENQDQENNPIERQDLNESTLDLSLGLKAHDGENETNSIADQVKEDQLD